MQCGERKKNQKINKKVFVVKKYFISLLTEDKMKE